MVSANNSLSFGIMKPYFEGHTVRKTVKIRGLVIINHIPAPMGTRFDEFTSVDVRMLLFPPRNFAQLTTAWLAAARWHSLAKFNLYHID